MGGRRVCDLFSYKAVPPGFQTGPPIFEDLKLRLWRDDMVANRLRSFLYQLPFRLGLRGEVRSSGGAVLFLYELVVSRYPRFLCDILIVVGRLYSGGSGFLL